MTKTPRPFLTSLVTICLVTACGLGTEVGNGLKPSGGNTGSSKKAASQGQNNEQSNAPAPSETTNGGESSQDTNSAAEVVPSNYDFDTNLVLAPCGSPFDSTIASPIKLGTPQSDGSLRNVIIATYTTADSGVATWHMKTGEGVELGTNMPTMTCSTLTTTTDATIAGQSGSFVKHTLTVTAPSSAASLTWYLVPATDDAKAKLARVEVLVEGSSTPIVMTSQPVQ